MCEGIIPLYNTFTYNMKMFLHRAFNNLRRIFTKGGCYDCGQDYDENEGWIESVIPDLIWQEITPTAYDNPQGGILCISCIAKRLKQKGYGGVPVWLCGCEPLRAMAGTPNDNLHLLRRYSQKTSSIF